jgi:enamine deaminase RidA (YjgF/YER057c/UK114 family)
MRLPQIQTPAIALPQLTPAPPAWVDTLLGSATHEHRDAAGIGVSTAEVATGAHFTHVCVRIVGTDVMSPEGLGGSVRDAYLAIADELTRQSRHPVRFWNFVPAIHTPVGDGTDRYMVFNAGRFAACEHWHGSPNAFDHTLAAASGVGVQGETLAIHCLAADVPGRPVENPRQVPAYRYSRRYGPRPPCFARATRVTRLIDDAWWLLAAGTASIRGEDTMFVDDVVQQTVETFSNLDALLEAAERVHRADTAEAAALSSPVFTSLRIYVVREGDFDAVRALVTSRYPTVQDVEYAQAELCRPDLLVEIEGVAEL